MHYLKTRYFAKWAAKQGIPDELLRKAITEFEQGLFEASLGNHLFKKRIAIKGRGKSAGARTILFYQEGNRLIFCFGFKKNQQDDLKDADLKILHKFSENLRTMTPGAIARNIQERALIEISITEGGHEKYH